MKHIHTALLSLALLAFAAPAFAADAKQGAAGDIKAGAAEVKPKAAAAAKVKLVDINSAGKAELKKLPGISDADADKIIAGRPYGSKAHLTTHGIISREVYESLKALVIAKQKPDVKAKPVK